MKLWLNLQSCGVFDAGGCYPDWVQRLCGEFQVDLAFCRDDSTSFAGIDAEMVQHKAILKIIKHCKEFSPALVSEHLLGLDVGNVLEVTNCFREEDEELAAEGANYQLEMSKTNNYTAGWYQSTLMGSYQTVELIETFIKYKFTIQKKRFLVLRLIFRNYSE